MLYLQLRKIKWRHFMKRILLSILMMGLVINPLQAYSFSLNPFNWNKRSAQEEQTQSALLLKKAIKNSDQSLFAREYNKTFGNDVTALSQDKKDLLEHLMHYEKAQRKYWQQRKPTFVPGASYLTAGLGLLAGGAYYSYEFFQTLVQASVLAKLLCSSEEHVIKYAFKVGVPLICLSMYTGYQCLKSGAHNLFKWYVGDNYRKSERKYIAQTLQRAFYEIKQNKSKLGRSAIEAWVKGYDAQKFNESTEKEFEQHINSATEKLKDARKRLEERDKVPHTGLPLETINMYLTKFNPDNYDDSKAQTESTSLGEIEERLGNVKQRLTSLSHDFKAIKQQQPNNIDEVNDEEIVQRTKREMFTVESQQLSSPCTIEDEEASNRLEWERQLANQ